ncbi:hypothetical protein ACH50O_11805 [Methylomonas sp. 2BW1-5-20]|uniref:hypothetical protein n=1 Tax=Methylomonas sp. 2BW1-5-20 TaxID=3376686 RepID=UPI0040520F47
MKDHKDVEEQAIMVARQLISYSECATEQDKANVLMKLVSVCGVEMCRTVGFSEAITRMQGTTDFIANLPARAGIKADVTDVVEKITWVPVSDRLPDDDMAVLICHPTLNEPVWLGVHTQGKWKLLSTLGDFLNPGIVIHWAELPVGIEVGV